MQFCARATEVNEANSVNSSAPGMIGVFRYLVEDVPAGIIAQKCLCSGSIIEKGPSCGKHPVCSKFLSTFPLIIDCVRRIVRIQVDRR